MVQRFSKRFLWAAVMALTSSSSFAQSPAPANEVSVSVSRYTYAEPGNLRISIHGPKIGGEYTGTLVLGRQRRLFTQANFSGAIGSARYDGWCLPWLITPNSASPNGYALDLGDPSTCGESGDKDWYMESRGTVGREFGGGSWRWAPYTGIGLRFLSNGTTGTSGFRTDKYLYPPIGVIAHTGAGSHGVSLTVEYDPLVHGWQNTHNSKLGGGTVPATTTAPAFTLNGISDIAFVQQGGWALRASGRYHITRLWFVEPYFVHWSVDPSAVNYQTATFTVNNVTARQQLGAYEPFNQTNEFGVRWGVRF